MIDYTVVPDGPAAPTAPEPSAALRAVSDELLLLRREHSRIEDRIRALIAIERKLSSASPNSPYVEYDPRRGPPCHCLRCDYAWYPGVPDTLPKCCSRCGSAQWMIPPTATSRKPGDPPAASWSRRKTPPAELARRVRAAKARAREWNGRGQIAPRPEPPPPAPSHTPDYEFKWLVAVPVPAPTPSAPRPPSKETFTRDVFPPPPDPRAVLPPPPDPARISLSARLAQFRTADPSPEQPERIASRAPVPIPVIEETRETVAETAEEFPETIAETVETIRDIPPAEVGQPQTDAEREELARAKEAAWPTTKSDD
jgi:hypothetical protein